MARRRSTYPSESLTDLDTDSNSRNHATANQNNCLVTRLPRRAARALRVSYGFDASRSLAATVLLILIYENNQLARTAIFCKTMKLSFFQMLRDQLATVPPVEYEDLSGKTVVVIGANIGLGFEAAKHFAKMNPDRIILGCRSKERGEAAATSKNNPLPSCHSGSHFIYKELKTETGYESAELWVIDLARISSVVDFAERFEKEAGRIDILLLNAAIAPFAGQQLTADGYEPVLVIFSYAV